MIHISSQKICLFTCLTFKKGAENKCWTMLKNVEQYNRNIFDLELELIVKVKVKMLRENLNSRKTWGVLANSSLRWWIQNCTQNYFHLLGIWKSENFIFGIILCFLRATELSQTPKLSQMHTCPWDWWYINKLCIVE